MFSPFKIIKGKFGRMPCERFATFSYSGGRPESQVAQKMSQVAPGCPQVAQVVAQVVAHCVGSLFLALWPPGPHVSNQLVAVFHHFGTPCAKNLAVQIQRRIRTCLNQTGAYCFFEFDSRP